MCRSRGCRSAGSGPTCVAPDSGRGGAHDVVAVHGGVSRRVAARISSQPWPVGSLGNLAMAAALDSGLRPAILIKLANLLIQHSLYMPFMCLMFAWIDGGISVRFNVCIGIHHMRLTGHFFNSPQRHGPSQQFGTRHVVCRPLGQTQDVQNLIQ